MVGGRLLLIARSADCVCLGIKFGHKSFDRMAFHDRGVVGIGHHGVLGRDGFGVADHAEQRFVLVHTVNGELGVEDLVAAMLGVRLRKHHQLHIGGVALQVIESVDEVFDLVFGQGQAPLLVGSFQRSAATAQHVHKLHRLCGQGVEQLLSFCACSKHRLGHAVVQQRGDLRGLLCAQLGLATEQAGLHLDTELGHALHAEHVQAAVAGNVGGLGGPRRDRAQTGRDDESRTFASARIGVAIRQQGRQTLRLLGGRGGLGGDKMHKSGGDTRDLGVNSDQIGQELLGAERAQGVSTLKLSQMQGHEAACLCEGW